MLTINDVEKYKFGSAIFGYSRADVDEFASLVVEALQHYVDEIEALKKQVASTEAELERHRASEATLRDSIVLAQKSRDEIIANAQKEAENILAAARVKTVEMTAKHAEVTAARQRFEYEFYGLLKGFVQTLEANNPKLPQAASPQSPHFGPEGDSGRLEDEEPSSGEVVFPEEESH
jgi:cell division initiation protein